MCLCGSGRLDKGYDLYECSFIGTDGVYFLCLNDMCLESRIGYATGYVLETRTDFMLIVIATS